MKNSTLEYYDKVIDSFIQDYESGFCGLLMWLYTGDIKDRKQFMTLVNAYGLPYIETPEMTYLPNNNETGHPYLETATLAGFELIFRRLQKIDGDICPMYRVCKDGRFSEESKSLGGNVNDYAALSAKGDTANIWQGNRSEILLPKPPHNKLSFAIKADTSFHQGDRILLNFKSQFIFQDGTKNAVATLSVRFRNDSIATQIQNFSSNGYTSVRIDDPEKVGIKEIRGYVSLINHLNDKSQTYKLLSIYDIQLIRMHVSSTHLEPGTERVDDGMAEQPIELERNENLPIPHERPSANSSPAIPQGHRSRVAAPNVEQEQEVIEPDAPVHRERLPLPHKRR